MAGSGRPRRFLDRLDAPAPDAEVHRRERAIGVARTVLLLAMVTATPRPGALHDPFAVLVRELTAWYFLYSLIPLALAWARPAWLAPLRAAVHAADLVWMVAITARPTDAFFVFSTLALIAAAYRWGFRETAVTTAAALLMLPFQGAALAAFSRAPRLWLEPIGLIVRSAHLLTVGMLLGYLAEREKRLRAESAVIARLLGRVQREGGLRGAMTAVLVEFQRLFGSAGVTVVVHDLADDRRVLWAVDERGSGSAEPRELGRSDRRGALADGPPEGWHAQRRDDESLDLLAVAPDGRLASGPAAQAGDALRVLDTPSLLSVPVSGGDEWVGRLLVSVPVMGRDRLALLRFAQTLVKEVGVAVYSAYVVGRLRGRASAIERTRVARELHDSVVQSLIGLEMELNVLGRRLAAEGTAAGAEVSRIEGLLHEQVMDTRSLMQQLKAAEVGPADLVESLAACVDRFRRDSRVEATFVAEERDFRLPAKACRELVRIAQEALVNVRKHSGARRVLVRLGSADGQVTLVVDDDGRGFPFEGTLMHRDLEAQRAGPIVIRERVGFIGGTLTVASNPGVGARLVIAVPTGGRP